MDHPYKSAPRTSFWKRSVSNGWHHLDLSSNTPLIRADEKVASAGSCFAANIVPYLERSGFDYVRTEPSPAVFNGFDENFSYGKFSAAYGNIYTPQQAKQLLARALSRFQPIEDRWFVEDGVIDPFRPGLRFYASTEREFNLLRAQHLSSTLDAFKRSDVFVFTLGLTEAWLSSSDGAVYPACPGTVPYDRGKTAGDFDPSKHRFHNFSAAETSEALSEFIRLAREINSRLRFILTVSPVPLVATATDQHVLLATIYSKSILRVAAEEVARQTAGVRYFPAYEIITGPQAPHSFFQDWPDPMRWSGFSLNA